MNPSARHKNMFLNTNIWSSNSRFRLLFCAAVSSLSLSACGGGSNDGIASLPDTVNNYHLISSTRYNQSGLYVSSTEYRYDFGENKITVVDADLSPDGSTNFFERYYSFYNADGNPTRTVFADERVSTSSYNTNGLLNELAETIILEGTNIPTTNVAKFEYDASGNMTSIIRTDTYGIFATFTYEYDLEGNLVSESHKKIFNEPGQLTVETPENTQITTTYFTTNNLGQLVKAETTDPESGLTYTDSYSYDRNGNMVERLTNHAGEFHRTTYIYEANAEPIANFWLFNLKYFP
jgi:hypothetical protein